jgi:hypothetical protein
MPLGSGPAFILTRSSSRSLMGLLVMNAAEIVVRLIGHQRYRRLSGR